MSSSNPNTPASAKAGRKTRSRRFSSSLQSQRDRSLWELIEIADLLLEKGSLSELDRTTADYDEVLSVELGIKLQINANAVKRILKLRELIFNDSAWKLLKDSSRLGIFSEFHFTKPYGTIKNDGGTLSLDLLDAFINGRDTPIQSEDLQQRSKTRKLDVIALSYSREARDFIVTMFLKSVAAIATLCSFISDTNEITWSQIMDVIARYTSDSWNSAAKLKKYHSDINKVHLVDGWHLVSEVYKIQVQELHFMKASSTHCSGNPVIVLLDDVKDKVCEFTKHLVGEFLAWCVQFLRDDQKRGYSTDGLLDTVDELYEKLVESIGVKANDDDTIGEQYLTDLIERVAEKHPTMAEIKYECKEMTPCRREVRLNFSKRDIVWRTADIFKRCRWDGSSAVQEYKAYLERARSEDEKGIEVELQERQRTDGISINPPSDDASMREETESKSTTDNHTAKRKASEMNEHRDAMAAREEQRKKRMRSMLASNSKRLTNALQHERMARGELLNNRYCDDGDSSDDEKMTETKRDEIMKEEEGVTLEVNLVMQLLYELILDWPLFPMESAKPYMITEGSLAELIVPPSKVARAEVSDVLTGDDRFVGIYAELRRTNFYTDVTKARSITRYAEHWRHILPFEIRGMVSDAVSELLPSVKADPRKKDRWAEDIDNDRYLNLFVQNASPEKGLINVTCRSTNPMLNRRLVTELQGGTLCVGYVRGLRDDREGKGRGRDNFMKRMTSTKPRVEKFSTLVLIACRRVHWEEDDEFEMANARGVNEVIVHLAISRERMKHINGVWENDTVRLVHLCPLSPHLRMFKSVQEATLLPDEVARVLCSPPEASPIVPARENLIAKVDRGCLEYLQKVRESTTLIDDSQMEALLSVLGSIGDAKPGSSSVSLVQGPPGTGKTTVLNILIGALLHHSTYGHVGGEEIHPLRNELGCDGILRRSTNPDSLSILVCAGSNQAVDNVLGRMDEDGIPDGNGGDLHPQSVRLARQGYDYGSLRKYSLNDKALPFDHHIHHIHQQNRTTASSAARRSFSKEVIVGLTTCSTSGGARLKNMKINWDVIIVDEAGQINEPETVIPIVNAYKRNIHRRSHTVLCGDQSQLSPMVSAMWIMKRAQKILPFNYAMQMKSLFERLERTKRCNFSMLTNQYRSHPCIAKLVSATFYEGVVKSVRPTSHFADAYNTGCTADGNGFGPVTLIDTSKLPSRYEHNDQKGGVHNMLEIDIVKEVLRELRVLTGDNFHHLRNQVAVLAPYRAQVNLARDMLASDHFYREGSGPTRKGFEILIDTVDSMQGDERDIVIFSATRSNNDQSVGFVDRPNRINVAISRPRKLLVIIADMSTVSVNKEFQSFWSYAAHGCNDSALLVRQASRPGDDTGYSRRFLRNDEEIRKYLLHARRIGQV